MRKLSTITFLVTLAVFSKSFADCSAYVEGEPGKTQYSFENDNVMGMHGFSLQNLKAFFHEFYNEGRRAKNRVYFNPSLNSYVTNSELVVKETAIDEKFIGAIQTHVETALKNKWAQFVFFSDMGHGHIYYPSNKILPPLTANVSDRQARLTQVLSDPSTQIVYHTSEELDLTGARDPQNKDHDFLQHLFLSRNILGTFAQKASAQVIDNPHRTEMVNTVRGLDGYSELQEMVIYIRANKNGCFPYKKDNQTFYFDIQI